MVLGLQLTTCQWCVCSDICQLMIVYLLVSVTSNILIYFIKYNQSMLREDSHAAYQCIHSFFCIFFFFHFFLCSYDTWNQIQSLNPFLIISKNWSRKLWILMTTFFRQNFGEFSSFKCSSIKTTIILHLLARSRVVLSPFP